MKAKINILRILIMLVALSAAVGNVAAQCGDPNKHCGTTATPPGPRRLTHGRNVTPPRRVARRPTELEMASAAAANLADAAGDLLYNDKEYAGAEDQYRQALSLQPRNPAYNNHVGMALFNQKKFLESEQYFREAVRLAPRDAAFHHNLGRTLYYQGKYAEAETQYREASRLAPGNAGYSKDVAEAAAARRSNSAGTKNPGAVHSSETKGDFSAPKYAVMTFFAAAEHRDIDLLSQCFDAGSPNEFRKLRERTASKKELEDLAMFVEGAQILDVQEYDVDKAEVSVKFKDRDEKIVLRKSNGIWRILDF